MKKRFAAALLLTLLLMQGRYAGAKAPTDEISGAQELIGMGILNTDFLEDSPSITRGEFASIAIKFHGRNPEYVVSATAHYFADVDSATPYAHFIHAAAALGIVHGYSAPPAIHHLLPYEPEFKPNQAITAAEAITMLLRTLGYDGYAHINGGYPTGYMTAAAQYQLLPGVAADARLTREQAVNLLIGALSVYCMDTANYIDTPQYVVANGIGAARPEWQSIAAIMPTFITAETRRGRNIHQELHDDDLFGDGEPWFLLDDANRVVLSCANSQQIQMQMADGLDTVALSLPDDVQAHLADSQDIKFVKGVLLCYRGSLSVVYDAQQNTCFFPVMQ